jgi:hypothetical protein
MRTQLKNRGTNLHLWPTEIKKFSGGASPSPYLLWRLTSAAVGVATLRFTKFFLDKSDLLCNVQKFSHECSVSDVGRRSWQLLNIRPTSNRSTGPVEPHRFTRITNRITLSVRMTAKPHCFSAESNENSSKNRIRQLRGPQDGKI